MTDIETFLARLARLAAKFPDVEAVVVWGDEDGWDSQDDTSELLDAEEIAFYAEGLLIAGFSMLWRAIAEDVSPKVPDHIVLMFWQGNAPKPPEPEAGWLILAQEEFSYENSSTPNESART